MKTIQHWQESKTPKDAAEQKHIVLSIVRKKSCQSKRMALVSGASQPGYHPKTYWKKQRLSKTRIHERWKTEKKTQSQAKPIEIYGKMGVSLCVSSSDRSNCATALKVEAATTSSEVAGDQTTSPWSLRGLSVESPVHWMLWAWSNSGVFMVTLSEFWGAEMTRCEMEKGEVKKIERRKEQKERKKQRIERE